MYTMFNIQSHPCELHCRPVLVTQEQLYSLFKICHICITYITVFKYKLCYKINFQLKFNVNSTLCKHSLLYIVIFNDCYCMFFSESNIYVEQINRKLSVSKGLSFLKGCLSKRIITGQSFFYTCTLYTHFIEIYARV